MVMCVGNRKWTILGTYRGKSEPEADALGQGLGIYSGCKCRTFPGTSATSEWVFRAILRILLLWELGLTRGTVPRPGDPVPQTTPEQAREAGGGGWCREAAHPSFVIEPLGFCSSKVSSCLSLDSTHHQGSHSGKFSAPTALSCPSFFPPTHTSTTL